METHKIELMKAVDTEWLRSQGCTFENGTIESAGIEIINGVATVGVNVTFDHGGCTLGGNTCGRLIPGDKSINGSRYGMDAILWLMAVAGVDKSSKIEGKYVRVAFGKDERACFIGHIVKDIWFSFDWLAEALAEQKEQK